MAPNVDAFILIVKTACNVTATVTGYMLEQLCSDQVKQAQQLRRCHRKCVEIADGIYLQCHHGVCGKDPAGEPGSLNVSADLTYGRASFSFGILASISMAL